MDVRFNPDFAPFPRGPINAAGQPWGEGRSTGLHVSEIIRFIRERVTGIKYVEQEGDPNWALIGLIFENMIEDAFSRYMSAARRDLIVSQSELCVDGVYLTPDAFNVEDGVCEEFKATYRSLRKLNEPDGMVTHFWPWLTQVAAYCYALGCDTARIVALFVMGDYSYRPPDGGPQIRCIEVTFTPQELEDNWKMLLANADAVRKEKEVRSAERQ